MSAVIKIKNSSTASAVPVAGDLVQGELAVNVADKRVFTKDATSAIVELGINPSSLTTASATITSLTTSGAASFADGSASAPAITNTGDTNTGIFFPAADTIAFATNGTEDARFDSAGNFGLGVTPSAWVSGDTVLQVKAGSGSGALWGRNNSLRIVGNTFFDGTNYKYIASDYASFMVCNPGTVGGFNWNIAASGTAGANATFTQAMTLDASGNLALGSTTSLSSSSNRVDLTVNGTSSSMVSFGTGGTRRGYALHDATDFSIASETAGALRFLNNGAERARINSSGQWLVGTTSGTTLSSIAWQTTLSGTANNFAVLNTSTSGGTTAAFQASNYTAGTANIINFYNGSGGVAGTISVPTNASTGTSVSYNTSSDYRLKENIAPMTGALAKVTQLRPVTYTWKSTGYEGQGFIAHELQAVVPECVTGDKDATEIQQYEISPAVPATFDDDGNELTPAVEAVMGEREVPVYQGIDTSFLVATLTAAIQEQQTLIASLTARIEALEA